MHADHLYALRDQYPPAPGEGTQDRKREWKCYGHRGCDPDQASIHSTVFGNTPAAASSWLHACQYCHKKQEEHGSESSLP